MSQSHARQHWSKVLRYVLKISSQMWGRQPHRLSSQPFHCDGGRRQDCPHEWQVSRLRHAMPLGRPRQVRSLHLCSFSFRGGWGFTFSTRFCSQETERRWKEGRGEREKEEDREEDQEDRQGATRAGRHHGGKGGGAETPWRGSRCFQ